MSISACLEIHQINVSQGDSVLIINRDPVRVKAAIDAARAKNAALPDPGEPIDHVPYAVHYDIPLKGTVTKALLIDGGNDEFGGDVVDYLSTHGVVDTSVAYQPNLYVMISHYHADHMDGLRSIFKRRKKPGSTVLVRNMHPARVYQAAGKRAGMSGGFIALQTDINEAMTGKPKKERTQLVAIFPGGLDTDEDYTKVWNPQAGTETDTAEVWLGNSASGIRISFRVIASGQAVRKKPYGGNVVVSSKTKTVDQNDRSIVGMLSYGSFRFFMGGDIAGDGGPAGGNRGNNDKAAQLLPNDALKSFTAHADVESPVGDALVRFFPMPHKRRPGKDKAASAGYATVMKANHHGSKSSNDVRLLASVQPMLFLISSGFRSLFHHHPTQHVINRTNDRVTPQWVDLTGARITNSIVQTYVTECADVVVTSKGSTKRFGVNLHDAPIMGDIVVRPVDESVLALRAADYNDYPDLVVQVYGTGTLTNLDRTRTTLRPTEPRNSAPGDIYPIGPFVHETEF
ncbi:hypothetical protein [Embleya sp. NPDC020886]|uniref:hypothetical protein n=1 Tax=Embleya sp. NPDC020886 TaxID=3363980 RepID=UPI0037BB307B